ncbi:hypothetical protein ACJJTC_003141 [Scirpophaga incertulas]
MNLIVIAAFVAVCAGDKLDRTYLPPPSAKSSGGSPGSLQTPFTGNSFNQGLGGLPKGSFTNEFQGVVVDAASAGTRASEGETGLGAPRISYGSTNSKVGDAAFRGVAGFKQINPQFNQNVDSDVEAANPITGFSQASTKVESTPERSQAPYDRVANTLRFENVVDTDSYHYAFETDNGISAEENGVAANGVQSQGGYSYTGDDGQVYSVTYTADEGGYQPKGDHLPTPPPIPEEILKSLEQNARDEAAGLIDDGSYDVQKYNAGSDYTETDVSHEEQHDTPSTNIGRRPESDATASSTFIDQNNQQFTRPNSNLIQDNTQNILNNNFRPSNAAVSQVHTSQINQLHQQNGLGNQHKLESHGIGFSNRQSQIPTGSNSAQFIGVNDGKTYSTEDVTGTKPGSRLPEYQSSQSFERPGSNKFSFNQKPLFDGVQNTAVTPPQNDFTNSQNTFGSRKEYLPPSSSHNILSQKSVIPQQVSQSSASFQPKSHSTTLSQVGFINSNIEQGNPTFDNQQKSQIGSEESKDVDRFPQNAGKAKDNVPFVPLLNPQRPTSVPSLELTTPFESNEQPRVQGGHSLNKVPSSFPNSQFSNVQIQSNRQPSSKPHSSINQEPYEQLESVQSDINQNTPNDAQFSPSTVRPTFNKQAIDHPYYYKQPAQPFNFPTMTESRFPSAAAGQFNRISQEPASSQFSSVPQNPALSNSYQIQRQQNHGSTRYPEPPTLAPTASTSSEQHLGSTTASQINGITQASVSPFHLQNQGSTKYPRPPTVAPTAPSKHVQGFPQHYNGITQATASSFVSSSPTSSSNFISQSPIVSRPTFQMTKYNKPSQSQSPTSQLFGQVGFPNVDGLDSSIKKDQGQRPSSVLSQQYSGPIYEYTKPSENLPAPHKSELTSDLQQDPSYSQFGSTQSFNNEPQHQTTRPSFDANQSGVQPQRTQFYAQNQPGQYSNSQYNVQSRPFGGKPQAPQFSGPQASTNFVTRPQSGSKPFRNHFDAQNQAGKDSTFQYNEQSKPFGDNPQAPQITGSQSSSSFATILQSGSQPSSTQLNNQDQNSTPQYNVQSRPLSGKHQSSQITGSQTSIQNNNRPNCCQSLNSKISQLESQKPGKDQDVSFGSQFPGTSSQSSSFAGRGEVFSAHRKPPSFDRETGYHY